MENKMHEIAALQAVLQKVSEECDDVQSPKPISNEPDLTSDNSNNVLMEKFELLQDRWDALSQILEAQSQRVSCFNAICF
jgi:hypothetical protein